MNLYLVSQDINNDYDTFDRMVVAARSEDEARRIHPYYDEYEMNNNWDADVWVSRAEIDRLTVELIGQTEKTTGVILASFNAG